MDLADLTVREFADLVASGAPAPGGGSAAAYCGAVGAALTAMAACLTQGRKKYAEFADRAAETEAEAKAQSTRAEGDAEYMRILSEVYDSEEEAEFYTFMIALDALSESMTGEEKTLILSADSPIAEIFK